MTSIRNKPAFYLRSVWRYDFRSSISLFFVALPLCLGISLASGAPVQAGLIAGVVGAVVVGLLSQSQLSVSGPAAGLTAICAAIISSSPVIDTFFLSVALAGVFQMVLGSLRLGGFTHFIPSAVIKGMLAGIGVLLISKQVPLLLGYDQPDFWRNEFFNILTFDQIATNLRSLYTHTSRGAVLISIVSFVILLVWKKWIADKVRLLPTSFITVAIASALAWWLNAQAGLFTIEADQFVSIPADLTANLHWIDFSLLFSDKQIWLNAFTICLVASLESLLSIEAIDKLDPYNRVTPQNRELIAQGVSNCVSGICSGLPVTAVIVRSAANAEAGAKTKMSGLLHGVWLLLAVLFAAHWLNVIPYAVLAVLLVRTGYNLVKPAMIKAVYRQGRDQFFPFIVTILMIVITDLLIGVLAGCLYALYFLIKHTYKAGFIVKEQQIDEVRHITIDLAINVSFLNKKRIIDMLDNIPEQANVTINGANSLFIDPDILEVFHDFKSKAKRKHIVLTAINIPEVQTIELHG
jgi:MFS superfamily sulfate permease-like transporter